MQRATIAFLLLALAGSAAAQGRLQSSDFRKLRSVGAVQWSPDGTRIAYTVTSNDGPDGRSNPHHAVSLQAHALRGQ